MTDGGTDVGDLAGVGLYPICPRITHLKIEHGKLATDIWAHQRLCDIIQPTTPYCRVRKFSPGLCIELQHIVSGIDVWAAVFASPVKKHGDIRSRVLNQTIRVASFLPPHHYNVFAGWWGDPRHSMV